MRVLTFVFLCLGLFLAILAASFPREIGVHERYGDGYDGGDIEYGYGYKKHDHSDSRSDSKSSSSSHSHSRSQERCPKHECPKSDECVCSTPAPTACSTPAACPVCAPVLRNQTKCPVKKSSATIPLFVANGFVAHATSSHGRQQEATLCDCDSGSLEFFEEAIVGNLQIGTVNNEGLNAYSLESDRGCPNMCIRDVFGNFWTMQSGSSTINLYFAPICTSTTSNSCFIWMGIDGGILTSAAGTYTNPGGSGNFLCDANKPVGSGNDCVAVLGISCSGCLPLKWASKYPMCYADPAYTYT